MIGLMLMVSGVPGAEEGLFRAYCRAGGPTAAGIDAFFGSSAVRVRRRRLGGNSVGGGCQGDVVDASSAQFFVNSSLAPVLLFPWRLKSATDVLEGIRQHGFTQTGWDALQKYWEGGVSSGPLWAGAQNGNLGWLDSPGSSWLLQMGFRGTSPYLVLKDPVDQTSRILVEPHLTDAEFRNAWMPFSVGQVILSSQWISFSAFVDPFLHLEAVLDLPRITGQDLVDTAGAEKSTPWFSSLAILLNMVESTGVGHRACLMLVFIPKADGDSTPLGQRPLSVLPEVYRLRASLMLGHLQEWVQGSESKSVCSLGNGVFSVEAWFSTALDIEEVLARIGSDQLHVMVADVIKSFDTVDMLRLRFKLASGLGGPWCRMAASHRGVL